MQNRTVLKLFGLIAPLLTWLVTLFIPGRNASVARKECANKCKIMQLVQSLGGYVNPDNPEPIERVLEKCYALGPFPALWAVEGVGKDLAEDRMKKGTSVEGMLPELDATWDKAQLMLHAGAGLGFAKFIIERMRSNPSQEEVHAGVVRIVDLCRVSSLPGYYGAAIESLGLVSRFLKSPAFCRQVHAALSSYAPDSVNFFWRGVGRCLYFHPVNFIPGLARPSRAFYLRRFEAPTPELDETMLSGMAWPLTIVNMGTPEVMEWVLSRWDDYDCSSPGFFTGMISTIVMRYDTTPDFALIREFRDHQPADPKIRELWTKHVAQSFDTAVESVHPVLKRHRRLDEVFQYQDLGALVERLEAQSHAR